MIYYSSYNNQKWGDLCMKGDIYTRQKCSICGGKMVHNPKRCGLFCISHPKQAAYADFFVKFGRDINKRFKSYEKAERFLTGLRWEVDQNTFDPRDYKVDQPLGFSNLIEKWLDIIKKEKRYGTFKNYRNFSLKAVSAWGNRSIKTITYADIEDFLSNQEVSDKTKNSMCSCLKVFFKWLVKRRVLKTIQLPEFPDVKFELGWRNTIDTETQIAIIDEVYKISFDVNPKIWIGIKWLSTYIAIRPIELINMKEKEIDSSNGYFYVSYTKDHKPKVIPILDEDLKLLGSLPKGLPDLFFFRHPKGVSGVKAGEKFGPRYLYKWWKKACNNLGVENVDLYGGTRHSTAKAMKEFATPEQIKRVTMHSTNKAFERYFQTDSEDVKILMGKRVEQQKLKSGVVKFSVNHNK